MNPFDTLIAKLKRRVSRTKQAKLRSQFRDGAVLAKQSAQGLLSLRACDKVGLGARVTGQRPYVENAGKISIGSFINLFCEIAPVALFTGPKGSLEIGDSVFINFGTILSANNSVKVGHRVLIGPYCVISDTEFSPGPQEVPVGDAIEIGDHAWLAARVTVLPGSRIGAGSVIKAGSVVAGCIPPGVIAGGVPARVLKQLIPAQKAHPNASMPNNEPPLGSTGIVVADFATHGLAQLLNALEPPNQIKFRDLSIGPLDAWLENLPAASSLVLWTRPERVIPAFARLLALESASESEVSSQVEEFVKIVERAADAYPVVVVPTWVVSRSYRNFVVEASITIAKVLFAMNSRLFSALAARRNVRVLDAQGWLECGGGVAMHPRLEREHDCPFHAEVLRAASRDIHSALSQMVGARRRLIVLEPNGTLWAGAPTNGAWGSTCVSEGDDVANAYADFHRVLKIFAKRSVAIGIVSKSKESATLAAFDALPEGFLRTQELAGWRINWNDKSSNVADLCSELNVPLAEVVYIDLDPVERSRIRRTLPELMVPEWPVDEQRFVDELLNLNCFDNASTGVPN